MAILRPLAENTLGAFALGSFLFLSNPTPARSTEIIEQKFDGMTVLALDAVSSEAGSNAPSAEYGAQRIREALEILRRRSPEYYRAVRALGRVYIEYDPADHLLASPSGPLALFRARTGVKELDRTGARTFVAVLGARVIQWPVAELAGIIVHELVGHGNQYYQNRLRAMDHKDRECEARLHQMRAYQDLGVAVADGTMAAFRTSLEDVWCQSFSSYLSDFWPGVHDLWTAGNLDAARLLVAFNTYRRYGARIRRWGERQPTTDSFDLAPSTGENDEDPVGLSLRGAQKLITYVQLVLREGEK